MKLLIVTGPEENVVLSRLAGEGAFPPDSLCFFSDAEAAWACLFASSAAAGDWAGVLIDLDAGAGDGLGLIRRIRESGLAVPVFLLAAPEADATLRAALEFQPDACCVKKADYLPALLRLIAAGVKKFRRASVRRQASLRVFHLECDEAAASVVRSHLARRAPHIDLTGFVDIDAAFHALSARPAGYDVLLLGARLTPGERGGFLERVHAAGIAPPPMVACVAPGDDAAYLQATMRGVADIVEMDADFPACLPIALERAHYRSMLAAGRTAYELIKDRGSVESKALDALPIGLVISDAGRRILYANPVFEHMSGYTREELIGKGVSFIIGVETSQEEVAHIRDALTAGLSYSGEFLCYRKDGSTFWNHLVISPVRDAAGRITHFVGMQHDVSERRKIESTLRSSEERFRQIADNIHEIFWLTDPAQRRVIYVNAAYERIFGRSSQELIDDPHSWRESIHPDDRERVIAAATHQYETQKFSESFRIVHPDGDLRWIRTQIYPIRDESGEPRYFIGTAMDITEQRYAEASLLQAQKLESIGTLAGGIAHDFNNILGAIIGYSDLLEMHIPRGTPGLEYLAPLQKSATRAISLIRKILTFSRQGEQKRCLLDLGKAIQEPLELLRSSIPTTIAFDVRIGEDLPPIQADLTQIHQVVMNLGANAAYAMRGRPGVLSVRLEAVDVTLPMLETCRSLSTGPHVRLRVGDTGYGMDAQTLKRIFDPFFTTKPVGEGTGLGLPVVHGIMRSHGGEVVVQSKPGRGARFDLYFPVEAKVGDASADDAPEKPVPRGDGERILLVDDEPNILHVGETILAHLGYRVEIADTAALALGRVRLTSEPLDLVITDLTMPEMTGVELARAIHLLRPGLPIVLSTGNSFAIPDKDVESCGINAFLAKPFTVLELGQVVCAALRQHGKTR